MKSQVQKCAPTTLPAACFMLGAEGAYCQVIRVGIFNTDGMLSESLPAKTSGAKIEAEFKSRGMELELAAASNDSGIKESQASFNAELNRRRNKELAQFLDLANAAMKAVAEDGIFDIVVQEDLPYKSKRVVVEDITQKMIDRLSTPVSGK